MDTGFIKEWLGLVALIITVPSALYTLLTSKASKAMADIEAHKKDMTSRHEAIVETLTGLDRRVQRVEDGFHHLPTKDAVSDLRLSIADLKGEIGKISQTAEQAVRGVNRVEAFLEKGRS